MNNSEDLFSKICRICLSVNNSRTVPLFDNINDLSSYGQAVASIASIQLPHLEYAPNNMCYSCLRQLQQSILFRKKCKNAQNFFTKKINFSKSHPRNVKKNIVKELYGKNDLIDNNNKDKNKNIHKDNLGKERVLKAKSFIDSKVSTFTNKSYVEILFEPLRSIDDNKGNEESDKESKTSLRDDKKQDIKENTDENIETDGATNGIFLKNNDSNEPSLRNENSDIDTNDIDGGNGSDNDIIYNLISLMENEVKEKKPKIEFKTEEHKNSVFNSKNNDIFKQMEEISNSIKNDDKETMNYLKIPVKDKIKNINAAFNSNLLEIEVNSFKPKSKNDLNDFIFEAMEESLNEELLKHNLLKKENEKIQEETLENYRKTLTLLEDEKRDNVEIKTANNVADKIKIEISKLEKLKEYKLAMRYLKVTKDAVVKFRNFNKKVDKKVSSKKKNRNEMRRDVNKTDFACKTCDRKFKSKNTLLRHAERHAGITAFMCEQCGKGFVTKSELEVHMVLSHGTGKHYPCEICGYKAPKPYDLKEHMRLHTGERPYACDQCGLTFRRLYIMRQHQICHTEKKFQCPKCPLRFYKITNLRAHDNNAHARRYMYACELCSRQYARNKTVRQHLTKVHGVPRDKQGKILRVFINETPLSQPPLEITANSNINVHM